MMLSKLKKFQRSYLLRAKMLGCLPGNAGSNPAMTATLKTVSTLLKFGAAFLLGNVLAWTVYYVLYVALSFNG